MRLERSSGFLLVTAKAALPSMSTHSFVLSCMTRAVSPSWSVSDARGYASVVEADGSGARDGASLDQRRCTASAPQQSHRQTRTCTALCCRRAAAEQARARSCSPISCRGGASSIMLRERRAAAGCSSAGMTAAPRTPITGDLHTPIFFSCACATVTWQNRSSGEPHATCIGAVTLHDGTCKHSVLTHPRVMFAVAVSL
jgi:hypothetical protein